MQSHRRGLQAQCAGRLANVDGVVPITHGSGCRMDAKGEGTLRGYANHPNVVGVLMIGLGCEVNQITPLMEELSPRAPQLLASLIIQESGGTRETVRDGIALIERMLPLVNTAQRRPAPLSHLTVSCRAAARTAIPVDD